MHVHQVACGPSGASERVCRAMVETPPHDPLTEANVQKLEAATMPVRMGSAARDGDEQEADEAAGPRHGALLQPEAEDWVVLELPYMTHWSNKRHATNGIPRPRRAEDLPDWRMRERLRTVTAALVMCLNIGVDPPDVSKTNPCSKLICWMDPESLDPTKALPAIGRNLQVQFETLSMKTRYKQYLDPIVEETKRFCTNLRRTAKDERVLFYYNGYGVPKPTPGGEIWVFNKAYTQYIPLTLYDLQTWLGHPCIYVWDTSAAGHIVANFRRLAELRAEDEVKLAAAEGREPPPIPSSDGIFTDAAGEPQFPLRDSIHLAACGPDEVLPMNPDLPADLFTCCLTSPIEISLRWFVLQNPLPSPLNVDMVMNIPGQLQDRRTPLGELNWTLTAVTDTIAWTVLPRALFRRFFRDDLMVAALLRNYLLAERIMRFYHCTPVSYPRLPPTHNHPLWDSWDLAVDQCLSQLPTLLAKEQARAEAENHGTPMPPHLAAFEYQHSTFFSEQLKAFEVWLSQGDVSRRPPRWRVQRHSVVRLYGDDSAHPLDADGDANDDNDPDVRVQHDPPSQLPIVLQVLLSQVHRLRALILLSQFLDLGPWAVNLALSIGIFPYVLKLLQSPAADLKPVLIYIWARILAVDQSCQVDLLRDNGYMYFASVLSPFHPNHVPGAAHGGQTLPIPNVSEHCAMCAFILAVFCRDFPLGQDACLETDVMDACLEHLEDDDYLLRQWSALCLAQLWDNNDVGKARAIAKDAHGKLCCLLSDASPEVRASILYALGVLLGTSGSMTIDVAHPTAAEQHRRRERTHGTARPPCVCTGALTGLTPVRQRNLEVGIAVAILASGSDCSPLVRRELVIVLSALVHYYHGFFVLAAYLYYMRESSVHDSSDAPNMSTKTEERIAQEEKLLAAVFEGVLQRGLAVEPSDIAHVPAFVTLFVALLDLSVDPHPHVANLASTVVDQIMSALLEHGSLHAANSVMRHQSLEQLTRPHAFPTAEGPTRAPVAAANPPREGPVRRTSASALSRTIRAISSMTGSPAPSHAPTHAEPTQPGMAAPKQPPHSRNTCAYLPPYDHATPQPVVADATASSRREVRMEDVLAECIASDLHRLNVRRHDDGLTTAWLGRVRERLPLKSSFFEWCSEYFTEPQMKSTEADEPGSSQYNRHMWRRQRCERHIAEAMEQVDDAGDVRWSKRVAVLTMPAPVRMFMFHEYDPHLVGVTEQDTLCVWDWEDHRLLSSFRHAPQPHGPMTSLAFINEEVEALLLTASADGNVHLFRRYDRAVPELVSAFRALPDLLRSRYPSGVRVNWQQVNGRLLTAGDSRLVRLWDAHRELCIADVPTHVNACATSITSDADIGHLFMVGFGDGSLGVYDQRHPPASSLVQLWDEHHAWVQNVHLQKHGRRELVSASVDGALRVWDIRARASILQSRVPTDHASLSDMAVHDRIPVLATTSSPHTAGPTIVHTTQLYSLHDLSPMGRPFHRALHSTAFSSSSMTVSASAAHAIRPVYERLAPLSPYSPSTSTVAFHPHSPVMAFGGPDHIVEIRRYS